MAKYKSLFTFFLLTLCLTLSLSGCDKDSGAYYPTPSSFEVKPTTTLDVPSSEGAIVFEISAGNLGWWIETDQDWITPVKKYGSGDGKATLKFKANNSGNPRSAHVTFHPTMDVKPVSFTIKQK